MWNIYRVDITATAVLPHTCIPGTCHSPKYRYVIVTVVYLVYCITAVCVSWLCDHRAYISDEYVVSMDAGCARNRRKLTFWEEFDAKYLHQVSCLFDACKKRRVLLNRWFDVKYSSCRHVCLVFRIESYLGTSLRWCGLQQYTPCHMS